LRAAEPVGVARGLTTLAQLLATGATTARILDAPRYAWRGLSLDVARHFFRVDELRRVIDLLAFYKLNVLHLHLTDDQGWRLPVPRPQSDHYSAEELRALVAYAAERFVAIVPEVDTPGHTAALVAIRPELDSGRNVRRAVWLDPELPATFDVMEEVLAAVADVFPGPYVHIGGDEPYEMPDDLYASYVRRLRGVVRSLGKRPLGWQECAQAGVGAGDLLQYWFADPAVAAAGVPLIVSPQSHCYLDVPYADPPADPAQAERHGRLGLRVHAPRTVEASFAWEPADTPGAAGVEAAIWAETIEDFDDLTFLLLPRLPGVAQKAWGDAAWAEHRARLARHAHLWERDGLTYFRVAEIG
jgi:hexosaminidase